MTESRIIKKYPNRRLYDTTESRYIAFKDINRLAVQNTPFTVIESTTGRDVTRQVLLQLIADLETRGPSVLSTATLMRITPNRQEKSVSGPIDRANHGLRRQRTALQTKERCLYSGDVGLGRAGAT